MSATAETVRAIAMALPATTEKPCWGTPAWYVKGKIFARILDDEVASVVVKVDFDERAALVQEDPSVYAVTPHYEGYPMVIVRLGKVRRADLEERLVEAWRFSAPPKLLKEFDSH
ncbi:MAG TPA: MmcQ/YjbR family DNA-binding protein [Acidimicrobiales bacterium]|nr:MmcQ/YjbR family DNA-binding protein [Acidimicrobiales bacterium]